MKMRVLDLFSGIGGFSLGLEEAGMMTVAFCEINPFCKMILRKHWPDILLYSDIRNLDKDDVGGVEVICGGFPCTQTSVAAAIHQCRDGLDGRDSSLWFEYFRLVQALRPIWVIIENPPGVKEWEGQIQGSLEGIGYRVSRLEIKASDFGLPHIRRRYFYVANSNGKRLEITRRSKSRQVDWSKRLATAGGSWLSGSPGTVGSLNGLSNRVDRVKAIGNSVVPMVVKEIGLAIIEAQMATTPGTNHNPNEVRQ